MKNVLIGVVCVALVGAYAFWFFSTHEKVVDERWVGPQGEARFNDFFAAQLLLEELDIEAESRASLVPTDWLPDYVDTIVVPAAVSFAIGEEQFVLNEWVQGGGHLVLLPPRQEIRQVDDLFNHFGVALVRTEPDYDDEDTETEDEDHDADAEDDDHAYHVDLDSTWYRIEILYDADHIATLSDDEGVIAFRQPWGDGFVTILATDRYFVGNQLRESDHARLLLDAVAGWIDPGKVWFIYSADFPSLWAVIWRAAPYLVVALTLLLLAWLANVIPRFGPRVSSSVPPRRSVIEHVRASGDFAWRARSAESLRAATSAALVHDAERKHPGISHISAEKQAEAIARMTGLSAQQVLDTLANDDVTNRRAFIHNMQTQQRIRKEL